MNNPRRINRQPRYNGLLPSGLPLRSGKRVLVVGAGNSGCDIAVDAVHYARSVDISVRRGYY